MRGELELWLPAADGSGVGESGSGRGQRPAVSLGKHDNRKSGELLCFPIKLCL